MLVYRISKKKYAQDLSGTGARLFGGRWNRKGQAVLYTSENRALAALEFLVHLEFLTVPEKYSLLTIELPQLDTEEIFIPPNLPPDWNKYPHSHSTQEIGNHWLTQTGNLVMKIPSTLIGREYNILLNPLHPAFNQVRLLELEDFIYDERLVTKAIS